MLHGIGIGLRPYISDDLLNNARELPRFIELNPEHYIGMGGYSRRVLDKIIEKYPIMGHGLSLSLGSPDPLDWEFLKKLKAFMKASSIRLFSEHLSYSKCDNAHFNGLFPVPFRHDAIQHMVERIKQVQDYLGEQIAVENISYYTTIEPEMSEAEFIRTIVEEADCKLLLDISNVYVNSQNQSYDPYEFLNQLPLERIAYIHIAGNYIDENGIVIDSHDAPVNDTALKLLDWTVSRIKPVPVLLERDLNFPDHFDELYNELASIQSVLNRHWNG